MKQRTIEIFETENNRKDKRDSVLSAVKIFLMAISTALVRNWMAASIQNENVPLSAALPFRCPDKQKIYVAPRTHFFIHTFQIKSNYKARANGTLNTPIDTKAA